ncbi:MAG: hypothetical protein V5789_01965 [Colwellia sp.]
MSAVSKQLLLEQWQTLHNSHERYEQYALLIKLVAGVITMLALTFSVSILAVLFLLTILWLQEAIWKTFQCRAAEAIITIENKLAASVDERSNDSLQPYLLYKDWQDSRASAPALIGEYIGNSLKPTVLYPYIPLMLVLIIFS